jgi:CHAT domain-containing protein/tetratricopeptide (TPR) repeat protein
VYILICLEILGPGTNPVEPTGQEENTPLQEIQTLIDQADSLLEAGQLDTTLVLGKYTLEKVKKESVEDNIYTVKLLNILSQCYLYQMKYSEAEPIILQSIDIGQRVLGPDHIEVSESLNNLGWFYMAQNKNTKAEPLFKQSLALMEKLRGPDHIDVARLVNNLAITYNAQARYAECESLFMRALSIRTKALGADHQDVAKSLNNLAVLFEHRGKYADAEPMFRRALEIRQKTLGPNHIRTGLSVLNLAKLCFFQGRYEESESLYLQAFETWENTLGPDHPRVAYCMTNLAVLYTDLGRYAEAESLHTLAMAINEKTIGPENPQYANSMNLMASLYGAKGDYVKAVNLSRKALALLEKIMGPDHPFIAVTLNNLALLLWDQGEYAEAESLYTKAIAILEKSVRPNNPAFAESFRNSARNYCSLGQFDRALEDYRRLLVSRKNFIDHLFSYASEEQKMRYLEKYPLIDHSLLSLAADDTSRGSWSIALEMVLKGKAIVIDAVSAEREITYCSYNEEILKKAGQHAAVCSEIASLTLTGTENLEPGIYLQRLETLYGMKNSLETELSSRCAEFKEEFESREFQLTDVSNVLPESGILLEFIRYAPCDFKTKGREEERIGPPRYLAFTLDHTGNVILADLGDAEEIDSLVFQTRKMIYDAKSMVYSPFASELKKQLNEVTEELYEKIFVPLISRFVDTPVKDIFLSPDGQLNLLPFEILPVSEDTYVIEEYNLSYVSSGRDLLKFKRERDYSDWALVVANPDFDISGKELTKRREKSGVDSEIFTPVSAYMRGGSDCLGTRFSPIPFSRNEMMTVASTLRKKASLSTELYQDGEAREDVLKGMTSAPRLLHLATHGYFCEDLDPGVFALRENPLLRSGLALAGANEIRYQADSNDRSGEDGILTAFEVSGLNLVGTELAILSACETGIGEVRNGEGVYGLRRAFQHAGAETIMMSLWKIPDRETCQLMGSFYENWLGGMTKKDSFRVSLLRVIENLRERYGVAHPLLWGGFVLAGNPY